VPVIRLNATEVFYSEVGEGIPLPGHARRLGLRPHYHAPLARPFGRRDASGLLRPPLQRSLG
jgi:hypothetical protein